MASQTPRDLFHRFEATPHGFGAPRVEELSHRRRSRVIPAALEGFAEQMSANALEVGAKQVGELGGLMLSEVLSIDDAPVKPVFHRAKTRTPRSWQRRLPSPFTTTASPNLMMEAARNLSTIMRAILGIGGPRSLQGLLALLKTAGIHVRTAPVGSGLPCGGAGRGRGAVVASHRRLMIRRSETQESTLAKGC